MRMTRRLRPGDEEESGDEGGPEEEKKQEILPSKLGPTGD